MRVQHENRLTVGPVRFDPTCRGIADRMQVATLKLYHLTYVYIILYF